VTAVEVEVQGNGLVAAARDVAVDRASVPSGPTLAAHQEHVVHVDPGVATLHDEDVEPAVTVDVADGESPPLLDGEPQRPRVPGVWRPESHREESPGDRDQIQMAIAIDVDHLCPRRDTASDPISSRDVEESARPTQVQPKRPVLAHEQVVPPVLVHIGNIDAEGPGLLREAQVHLAEPFTPDVHEGSVGSPMVVLARVVVPDEEVGVRVIVQVQEGGAPAPAPSIQHSVLTRHVHERSVWLLQPQLVVLLAGALLGALHAVEVETSVHIHIGPGTVVTVDLPVEGVDERGT
jgi:hypothetical protein